MRVDPADILRAVDDSVTCEMCGVRPKAAKCCNFDAVLINRAAADGGAVANRHGKSCGATLDDLVGEFLAPEIEEKNRALILLRRIEMVLVRRDTLIVAADQFFGKVAEPVGAFGHFRNGLSAVYRAALRNRPGDNRVERRINKRCPASDQLQRRRMMGKSVSMAATRRP